MSVWSSRIVRPSVVAKSARHKPLHTASPHRLRGAMLTTECLMCPNCHCLRRGDRIFPHSLKILRKRAMGLNPPCGLGMSFRWKLLSRSGKAPCISTLLSQSAKKARWSSGKVAKLRGCMPSTTEVDGRNDFAALRICSVVMGGRA